MIKRAIIVALPLAFLAGCGGDDSKTYAISTGTYAVSSATSAQAVDTCGLLAAYQDPAKRIGITVTGTDAMFNLANDPLAASDSLPHAVINGNSLDPSTEANYTIAYGTTCVVRVRRSVTGDITANDQAALQLTFSAQTDAGTCTAAETSFTAMPCNSSYHFVATKLQ